MALGEIIMMRVGGQFRDNSIRRRVDTGLRLSHDIGMDQSLNYAAVIKAAGIPDQGAIWADAWPDSQASFHLNDL